MTRMSLPPLTLPTLSIGQPQLPMMDPEQEKSILRQLGEATMSGLQAAGNFLDIPGSMARDVLAGENPLDQLLTPFSHENRTTGRDLLRRYGAIGEEDTGWNWLGGLATEVATDPLTWLTPLALTKLGKTAQMTGKLAATLPEQVAAGQRGTLGFRVPLSGLFGEHIATDLIGPTKAAQKAAEGLSWLGNMVRYSPPGRMAAAMLHAPSGGAMTEQVQKDLAQPLFKAMRADEATVRGDAAWMTNRMVEEGNIGPTAAEEARRGFEGVAKPTDAPIPADVFDRFHEVKAETRAKGNVLGVGAPDLMEREHVAQEHVHRRKGGESWASGMGRQQWTGMHGERIAREEPLVNIPGASTEINEIYRDPVIGDMIDRTDLLDENARNGLIWRVKEEIQKRWAGTVHYSVPDKKVEDLAKMIINATPEERRIGLFPNHPIVDWMHGEINARQANTMTEHLYDFLTAPGAPLVPKGQGPSMRAVVKSWKIDPSRAAAHFNYRMGTSAGEGILDELAVRPDVARDLTKVWDRFTSPRSVSEFLKHVDGMHNLWKFVQTSSDPQFHGRNFLSGQVQNYLANMWSKDSLHMSNAIDEGKVAVGSSKIPLLARELERRKLLVTDENATKLIQEFSFAHDMTPKYETAGLMREGIPESGEMGGDIEQLISAMPGGKPSTWGQVPRAIRGKEPGTVPAWKMPLFSEGATIRGVGGAETSGWGWAAAGDIAGRKIETANRLSPFIELMRQVPDELASKMKPDDLKGFLQYAAHKVGAAQVLYQGKYYTPVERDILKRIFPFYSFTSRQIPYLMRQMADPGSRVSWAIRAEARATNPETILPPYVSQTTAIPLGESEPGHQRFLTGFGLMHEDPLQLGVPIPGIGTGIRGTLLEVASRMNPVMKSALEWATGQSMFQTTPAGGRQLEELDPTMGRIGANIKQWLTGQQTRKPAPWPSQGAEFIAGNLLGRPLFKLRVATDPRKWTGYGLPLAANWLTGLRVADVSPTAMDSAAADAIAAVLREQGARDFVRPYLPQSVKERMTPEELASVNQGLMFQRALDQRMKAQNKKAKAAAVNQ